MDRNPALVRSLNRLIATLSDTIAQYDAAAEHAHSYGAYAEYARDIAMRRAIVRQLGTMVTDLGGEPRRGGTVRGWIKTRFIHLYGIGVGNELFALRLFEHEERQLISCIEALVVNDDVPAALRHELAEVVGQLDEELTRLEWFHRGSSEGTSIAC